MISRTTKADGTGDGEYGYIYRQAMIRNPTDRVKTESGAWQERDGYFYENPVSRIYEANYQSAFKEMRLSGSLDYAPINNLNFKLLVSNVQNSNLDGGSTTFNHTNTRLNNQMQQRLEAHMPTRKTSWSSQVTIPSQSENIG